MYQKSLLYARCSTSHKNTDRQLTEQNKYPLVLVDYCSGTIPIFERPKGKKLQGLIKEQTVKEIHIHAIDRCARNLKDLLEFIDFCHSYGVSIFIKSLGMKTLNDEGKMNYVIKMMISVMGSFAEIENEIRRERQMEGIAIAKMQGKYKNRPTRGKETPMKFLERHSKAVKYLQMGMKGSEVIRLLDNNISENTIKNILKI